MSREQHTEFSFVLSSNPENGASNITNNGSSFELLLNEPLLVVPKHAYNLRLTCPVTTMWWNIPNVVTGENDRITIKGYDNANNIQTFNIAIPQGLYKQDDLNLFIKTALVKHGAKVEDDTTLIEIKADSYTQKIMLELNYENTSVDFTAINSLSRGLNSVL